MIKRDLFITPVLVLVFLPVIQKGLGELMDGIRVELQDLDFELSG